MNETIKELNKIKKDMEKNRGIMFGNFIVSNYLQNVESFYEMQPFFYDDAGLFWLWNSEYHYYEIVDEIDIMNMIDAKLRFLGETIKSNIKNNYLESFKRVGRLKKPKEVPKTWVQFKDKIFDIKTKKIFDATPEYFTCNPIDWELGKTSDTPTIDKLFKEWVGEKYVRTLYEIVAYCCLTDYPISITFCLIGGGRNGKTKFQGLIQKFMGIKNICSTELDSLIDNRFESAKLFKKLVCVMGETNFGTLKRTSLLKKLCGGDLIGFEFKNKKPFDDYNYAKIIINSNSLPISDDKSEGFYRRWFIIDFPNQFQEGKDILETIPDIEYSNLARKCIKILPQLLERGKFTNQGTIEERKDKYVLASNPLPFFIQNFCDVKTDTFSKHFDIFNTYQKFLMMIKRRPLTRKEFNPLLVEEGFEAHRTTKLIDGEYVRGWYIECLTLKPNFEQLIKKLSTLSTLSSSLPLNSLYIESSSFLVDKVDKVDKDKITTNKSKEGLNDLYILSTNELIIQKLEEKGGKMEFHDLLEVTKCKVLDIENLIKQGLVMENPKGTVRLI